VTGSSIRPGLPNCRDGSVWLGRGHAVIGDLSEEKHVPPSFR